MLTNNGVIYTQCQGDALNVIDNSYGNTRRGMSFGEALDKLLIASIGIIFVWFGLRLENLTTKVEQLLTAMATTTAKQDSAFQRIESNDKRIDKLEETVTAHAKEDAATLRLLRNK